MAALRETIQNSSNPTDTSISSSTSHIDFSNLFLLFYHILKFTFLIYYFVSLSLRLSFMNFTFTSPYLGSILVDYLIDLFFIIDYISFEYHHSISNTIVVPIDSVAESAEIVSIDFMRSARRNSASSLGEFYVAKSSFFHPQRFLYEIICTLPMEIVGYLIHYPHFPWLRLNRLLRIYSAIEYWSHIIQAFERCGVQIKSSVSRILLGCLFHTIICHFAGCAYYILAIFTMKDGHGKTWLSHDNSVVLDDESNELVFIRPKYQIYIRAIYWSAQTLV